MTPDGAQQDQPLTQLVDAFRETLNHCFAGSAPIRLAVAVSGGGDSVALLLLLQDWAQDTGCKISAATVDHALRPGSAAEAQGVKALCQNLAIPHATLTWKGWDGTGNLQQAARQARYRLISDWAEHQEIHHVALGHTLDDQAETVLMRLARGAGVDGLSAMALRRDRGGITWLRPLLTTPRQTLRQFLTASGISWVDDPSNEDERFERVRVRNLLSQLAPLGLDATALGAMAGRMASARQALAGAAAEAARRIVSIGAGAVFFDREGFLALYGETRRRLLSHALCWVSSQAYPPRAAALSELETALTLGKPATLHGCLIGAKGSEFYVTREFNGVRGLVCDPDQIWDHRWRIVGPQIPGTQIRATGETGLKSCPDWKDCGLDRAILTAAPAIWRGEELIAAPLAGQGHGWQAKLLQNETDFIASILSH